MKYLVLIYYCFVLVTQEFVDSEAVGAAPANNNANKPQPSPNKRPLPLWTSAKILTLLIVLSIVVGGLLCCCCFQFSCSITIRNFTEENTALLNKPTKRAEKYDSENQLERWE